MFAVAAAELNVERIFGSTKYPVIDEGFVRDKTDSSS